MQLIKFEFKKAVKKIGESLSDGIICMVQKIINRTDFF